MATGLATRLGEECRSALSRSTSPSLLKVAVTTVFVLILFGAVLADMARDWWNEPSLSQGMLLPPLALYIAWLHRRKTLSIPAILDTRGLLLITAACLIFLLGKLATEFFLMRFSFVILLA